MSGVELILVAISVVLGVWVLALWWRGKRWQTRVDGLRREVDALSRGTDPSYLVPPRSEPVGGLARSFNRLVFDLAVQRQHLMTQVNQHQALLGSMVEGVIAVDPDDRVIRLNDAAVALLRLESDVAERAVGRSIQEVVRNTVLLELVGRVLDDQQPAVTDVVIRNSGSQNAPGLSNNDSERGDHYLQAQAAALLDASGKRIGVLIVLHDVTRLRRLEMVRRDFVANVSHEIKTPVTAIKGFVETLLDEPDGDPEQTQRFLRILDRQADRLHAIVEDLLTLARIEQDTGQQKVALESGPVLPVLYASQEACLLRAKAKDLTIEIACSNDLYVMLHAPLLEQAVTNLLDNAIKYSPASATIWIGASPTPDGDEVQITVRDQGSGIPAEHIPRLFERFYRVDRARSRELGGTGLGLSIVKYIAQAHHGRVDVQSATGQGSTFQLFLARSDAMHAADTEHGLDRDARVTPM